MTSSPDGDDISQEVATVQRVVAPAARKHGNGAGGGVGVRDGAPWPNGDETEDGLQVKGGKRTQEDDPHRDRARRLAFTRKAVRLRWLGRRSSTSSAMAPQLRWGRVGTDASCQLTELG
ncbi:unnamed protein product [Lampetra planeri]